MNLPDLTKAKVRTSNRVSIIKNDYKIPDSVKEIGKGKKFYLKTYGCQMNVHDSENIKGMLNDLMYTETDVMDEADLIILNTCAIRENAHNKVFGFLGRVKHLKEYKPNIIVGLCGCMAQEENVVNILKKYTFVNIVFGTHNLHKLPELLASSIEKNAQEIEIYSIEGNVYENIPVKRDSKYKAWVNIQFGCDKFCTYCIVPYTRGKQRSRMPEDILNEVEELVSEGYLEVTLLGQNVNAYGKDLDMNYTMANLLRDVAQTGIKRVRFVTSHPWDFSDDMIDVIAKYDNIMPYIHLPLQSGSDRILKLMGRRYTKEDYLTLFNKLKEKIPNCAITTDIIVSFPGETEEDFKDTLDVVNKCQYDSAFTFIYSPREGTPAAKMENELNEVVNKYALENNLKYKGKTVPVLIEGIGEKDTLFGYADTMKLVNVVGDVDNIGKIIDVEITDVKTWSLDGIIKKS